MKKWGFFFLICLGFFASLHTGNASSSSVVNVVKIEDYVINPVVSEYLSNAIERSEKEGAQCLVIELDTPGGLLTTTRNIVKEIMNADVPIVVYVAPSGARAGSAGVFITLSSHIAAMAPSTNIGAAHPVNLGEKRPGTKDDSMKRIFDRFIPSKEKEAEKKKTPEAAEGKKVKETTPMEDKILNDTVAWVRGIAQQRGRNEEWAVRSVVESISSDAREALEKGVVDYVCSDLNELLNLIDGRKVVLPDREVVLSTQQVQVVQIPMTKRQSILNVLSNPNIAYILMLLGFYGLLYEITNPGFGVPGIAGLICLVVAFYSLQTLPVNYAGLILIILALVLFVAEAMVTSFGLLALAGVISMFLGSLMLIDSPASFMRISLRYILPVVLVTAGLTVFLVSMVVRAHRKQVKTGLEGLVGEEGRAETKLSPKKEGTVYLHGEIWTAESDQNVDKGDKIRVKEVRGMKLLVEKI